MQQRGALHSELQARFAGWHALCYALQHACHISAAVSPSARCASCSRVARHTASCRHAVWCADAMAGCKGSTVVYCSLAPHGIQLLFVHLMPPTLPASAQFEQLSPAMHCNILCCRQTCMLRGSAHILKVRRFGKAAKRDRQQPELGHQPAPGSPA